MRYPGPARIGRSWDIFLGETLQLHSELPPTKTLSGNETWQWEIAYKWSFLSLKLGALVRIVMIMLWVRRKHRDRKTSAGIHQTNQSNGSSEHDGINGGIDGEGAEDEFHADSDDDIATELILEVIYMQINDSFSI